MVTDASTVLRTHPWPGRPLGDTFDPHRRRRPRKTFSLYRLLCGQRSDATESDDESIGSDDDNDDDKLSNSTQPLDWYWTQELMDDFRHEMEKLVILCVYTVPVARRLKPAQRLARPVLYDYTYTDIHRHL